jgi:hypothetical protein
MNLPLRIPHLTRPARLLALAGVASAVTVALTPAPAHADPTPSVIEVPHEVRHLKGFWANEHVPACSCPDSHPWLLKENYAPWKRLPDGVSIDEDWGSWPIDVSISGTWVDSDGFRTGTKTGFPNSSATNWAGGDHWYRVVLHCTKFESLASKVNAPPQEIPA